MNPCVRIAARLFSLGCFLLLFLPMGWADDVPSVRGPVPGFAENRLEVKISARRYCDVRYPQFWQERIDEALRMFAESLADEISQPEGGERSPDIAVLEDAAENITVGYSLTASSSRYLSSCSRPGTISAARTHPGICMRLPST